MSKRTAHIILALANIFCLFVFLYALREVNQIFANVANLSDSISFGNRIGFALIAIVMPFAQVLAIWEHYWPEAVHKRTELINRAVIVVGTGLIAGAILFSVYLQNHVEDAGYVYCDGAMRPGSLFKTLVYARDDEVCRRLTSEYRVSMHLPPK